MRERETESGKIKNKETSTVNVKCVGSRKLMTRMTWRKLLKTEVTRKYCYGGEIEECARM